MMIWCVNDLFMGVGCFCYIFQLKLIDGDSGVLFVIILIYDGLLFVLVQYWVGFVKFLIIVCEFFWMFGQWQIVCICVKMFVEVDGEVLVLVNGDEFQGVCGVVVYCMGVMDFCFKWGFYCNVVFGLLLGDDYIEY